ncbi:MAG: Hsp20/alpha crystallin family protein [Deltaproteobacteria bacterium]|nr:Hsp20/alpha crystallin family protein [Deltaproteobacteria bacterium]
MPGLVLWKNREIQRLRRDIDRLFARLWDDFGMGYPHTLERRMPHLDLSETDDSLVVKAELPGVDPRDLDISIMEDLLTIKGEMRQTTTDKEAAYHRIERRYGYFSRSIRLPCKVSIDDARATYDKGVLTIVMPKCEPDRPREIKISVK